MKKSALIIGAFTKAENNVFTGKLEILPDGVAFTNRRSHGAGALSRRWASLPLGHRPRTGRPSLGEGGLSAPNASALSHGAGARPVACIIQVKGRLAYPARHSRVRPAPHG
jgi:hypothetical protein